MMKEILPTLSKVSRLWSKEKSIEKRTNREHIYILFHRLEDLYRVSGPKLMGKLRFPEALSLLWRYLSNIVSPWSKTMKEKAS